MLVGKARRDGHIRTHDQLPALLDQCLQLVMVHRPLHPHTFLSFARAPRLVTTTDGNSRNNEITRNRHWKNIPGARAGAVYRLSAGDDPDRIRTPANRAASLPLCTPIKAYLED